MQRLSFQDAFFLRVETQATPFHVSSMAILTPPKGHARDYFRTLVKKFERLHEVWPIFGLKLDNPTSTRSPAWIEADDFDPKDHVFHYSLPKWSKREDLLHLVNSSHTKLLDRSRPMWELHLIEGLPKGQFAIFTKIHHALIDGVGGLRVMQEMYNADPEHDLLNRETKNIEKDDHSEESLGEMVKNALSSVLKQTQALPEAYSYISNLGLSQLLGKKDAPNVPFQSPRTVFNSELGSRRCLIFCDLPLSEVKGVGKVFGGTINDVVTAIFGSALRKYLLEIDKLPKQSISAGMPVFLKKTKNSGGGNQLSFMICPFATDEADPVARLQKIINVTGKAKHDLSALLPETIKDLSSMSLAPFLMLSMTHTLQKFRPLYNAVVSNVPGPRQQMYLDGSRLEAMYPISIVSDGLGLNITLISYQDKLCVGVTAAPDNEPNIQVLGDYIQEGFEELRQRAQSSEQAVVDAPTETA